MKSPMKWDSRHYLTSRIRLDFEFCCVFRGVLVRQWFWCFKKAEGRNDISG